MCARSSSTIRRMCKTIVYTFLCVFRWKWFRNTCERQTKECLTLNTAVPEGLAHMDIWDKKKGTQYVSFLEITNFQGGFWGRIVHRQLILYHWLFFEKKEKKSCLSDRSSLGWFFFLPPHYGSQSRCSKDRYESPAAWGGGGGVWGLAKSVINTFMALVILWKGVVTITNKQWPQNITMHITKPSLAKPPHLLSKQENVNFIAHLAIKLGYFSM